MKTSSHIERVSMQMDDIISVCGAIPRGDELPQVAGEQDILMDVYSDMLNMPREFANARIHHQFADDEYDLENMIH